MPPPSPEGSRSDLATAIAIDAVLLFFALGHCTFIVRRRLKAADGMAATLSDLYGLALAGVAWLQAPLLAALAAASGATSGGAWPWRALQAAVAALLFAHFALPVLAARERRAARRKARGQAHPGTP
ncbi:MAG TPA: hypothetical protein VFH47_02285 [Candidatus Thermoplasmatota archaeon]|nr:hypothetical protein [Candidatus Thermoplasmatota archaeon]